MKKLLRLLIIFLTVQHITQARTNIALVDTTLDVEIYTNGIVDFVPPSVDSNKGQNNAASIKKYEQKNQNETKIFTNKQDKGKSHGTAKIEVAKNTNLRFQTAIGNVTLTDVEGKVKGHVENGAITLTRGTGKVELVTETGDVSVIEAGSSGFVISRSGNVILQDVSGDLKGIAPKGKVSFKTTSNFFTKKTASKFALNYDQADIEIANAPEGGDFRAKKGDITVFNSQKNITMYTEEGNLKVSSLGMGVRASTRKGKISLQIATNNNAEEPIIIEAQDGDVELIVGNNFKGNFSISLSQTKNFTTPYQVVSFLELGTITPQEIRDTKTKVLYGREFQINQVIGKGKRPVQIRVLNGNLYIRKS